MATLGTLSLSLLLLLSDLGIRINVAAPRELAVTAAASVMGQFMVISVGLRQEVGETLSEPRGDLGPVLPTSICKGPEAEAGGYEPRKTCAHDGSGHGGRFDKEAVGSVVETRHTGGEDDLVARIDAVEGEAG
jgi:hypothetical protein